MTEQHERTVVVNIHLTKGLVAVLTAALVVLAALAYMRWRAAPVAASGPQEVEAAVSASGRRQFYFAWNSPRSGSGALTACEAGYHMASLWEIMDVSDLEYNAQYGRGAADAGSGPPTDYVGWVRTGFGASGTASVPGQDNCDAWTTYDGSKWGTQASLPSEWGTSEDIHVWAVTVEPCNLISPVWCVED